MWHPHGRALRPVQVVNPVVSLWVVLPLFDIEPEEALIYSLLVADLETQLQLLMEALFLLERVEFEYKILSMLD